MAPQLASRGQSSFTGRHLLCRSLQPRSCSQTTAVRCFKGSHDEGAKPASTLRLNFRIPYRVNFGQSVALVGSGDSLGNWDPKRTVPMKWTDGDLWTVELTVAPGTSALDLEYKYVVVNSDGNIGHWKPGSNYRVTLPIQSNGAKVPKRVKVSDAWDDSYKKVDVEEAEVAPMPSSNGTGHSGKAAVQSQQQPQAAQPTQGRAAQQQPQPVGVRAATPPPQVLAAQAATTPPQGTAAEPASARSPPSTAPPAAATSTAEVRPPLAAQPPVGVMVNSSGAATTQAKASNNGVGASQPPPPLSPSSPPPTATVVSTPAPPPQAAQAQVPQPPPQQQVQAQPPTESPQRPQNGAPPRSPSPRMAPASFAAATSIPAIHPSLLTEQERLEEGVRNSLEDLQSKMDQHQQLRDRTDDPAAPEILVADRIVAAANNRVVAYNKALKAVQEYNRLPPPPSTLREASANSDK